MVIGRIGTTAKFKLLCELRSRNVSSSCKAILNVRKRYHRVFHPPAACDIKCHCSCLVYHKVHSLQGCFCELPF